MILALASLSLPDGLGSVATFLVLGTAAALLVGVAKAGFGGGIAILSAPLMIYACSGQAQVAFGIMLPILMVCDLVSLAVWRGKWDLARLRLLVPFGLVGIAAGATALWGFQRLGASSEQKDVANAAMKLGIGLISLAFVVLQGVRALRKTRAVYKPAVWHGACAGTAAGITFTLAHAAGPIVNMYLLPQGMTKACYVATTVAYFWLINLVKLGPYLYLGMVRTDTLAASAMLLPAVIIGAVAGAMLHHKLGNRSFAGIVYALLALAGVHLCTKAVVTLW